MSLSGLGPRQLRRRATRAWLGGFVCSLAACSGDGPIDSATIVPADTIVARALPLIGVLDGPPEYLFGQVSSVASSSGIVYVADRHGSTVRAYDTAGSYLGLIGGEGEGPGEFSNPNDITFDPDGRLVVRDRTRVTAFERRQGSLLPDSVVSTVSLGRSTFRSPRGATDGSLYYFPTFYYYLFVTHDFFGLVLDSDGQTGDTVPVPLPDPEIFGRANYLLPGGDGGQPLEGVNTAPFEAVHSWAFTRRGTVLISPGNRYQVRELSAAGDTLLEISRPASNRAVPAEVLRDSAAAFAARLDTIPVSLDEVRGMSDAARSQSPPRVFPEVLAVHTDLDGRIWVKRWPPDAQPDHTFFDVYSPDGQSLGTVRIEASLLPDPPPWVSAGVVVGVVRDPDTGIDRIALFELDANWQ